MIQDNRMSVQEFSRFFIICHSLASFSSRFDPSWAVVYFLDNVKSMYIIFRVFLIYTAAGFSNKALGIENEAFEVEKSQICVECWILPEGTL